MVHHWVGHNTTKAKGESGDKAKAKDTAKAKGIAAKAKAKL